MLWLSHDAPIAYRRREPHRDGIEAPILNQRFDFSQQVAWRHLSARLEFSPPRARNHYLHVGTADINDEDFFLHCVSDFVGPVAAASSTTAIGINRSARA